MGGISSSSQQYTWISMRPPFIVFEFVFLFQRLNNIAKCLFYCCATGFVYVCSPFIAIIISESESEATQPFLS